jgi:hypothetical protein
LRFSFKVSRLSDDDVELELLDEEDDLAVPVPLAAAVPDALMAPVELSALAELAFLIEPVELTEVSCVDVVIAEILMASSS